MPQTTEYQVIQEDKPTNLQTRINVLARDGYKPILMSSSTPAHGSGIITTIIVEKVLGQ
jgi:hypothetical protein